MLGPASEPHSSQYYSREVDAGNSASTTTIDWNKGNCQKLAMVASITTLTPAAVHGDYSSSIVPLWDFASCNWKSGACQQFPNNTLPPARIDPYWLRSIQMLPAPNTTAAASPNAFLQVAGSLSGSRFAVDAQNNSSLSTFGGVVQIPYGPFEVGVSTFSLYVDGKLIASKGLPYLLAQRAPVNFGPGDF